MALLSGARLCVLRKKGEGFICEVPIRTNLVTIGFDLHCTVRLKSELTEQLHCKIFVRNKKVTIANYSTKNPISVDGRVITKRGLLHDGSTIEVCGTRFRWQFDESLLANRLEKSKKIPSTPTSSKFGSRRRTTMVPKKVQPTEETAAVAGPSRKSGPKKTQKQPTYTLPKSNKQLIKKIKKRFTMHSVMIDHDLEEEDDEEAEEEETEQNESNASLSKADTSCETPKKLTAPDVSKNNTPFYTPDPEKENQTPVTVGKTPGTPKPLALENSAMMILSYTPVIGSRAKTNLQKTPLSKKKAATPLVQSGYLTPKNENISMNSTSAKGGQSVAKGGNSMYLIDLTSPTSANDSSFVYSQSDGSFSSSAGLIDLTTPPSKKLKTPSSTVARSAQKGLLRSALKNASKTPLSALRSRLAKDTPKSVSKIRLDDSVAKTPVTPAKGRTGSRPTTPASATSGKLRSHAGTPVVDSPIVSVGTCKPETPIAASTSHDKTPEPVMTTDELFDTLVGRPSVTKTYTRKSESPKKLPSPLVAVEGSSDLPKTDVDLWVESVVAAVTSPEPLESFIKKPNRTTQVRSSQYSDITPHDSFADTQNVAAVDPPEVTNEVENSTPVDDDELNNMTDKPSIPHVARKSHTPLASKIVRSLGNKRQTIGNFFTNMFGKLTVSPVTRVSITDENHSEETMEDLDRNSEHGSDGSEEVYHDSESDHPQEPDKPPEPIINPSPKLRQSLRDTRKFIGNALTSLNTSRLTMDDNTAEIDESLLLSDTYEDNANQMEAAEENYDLTDLSAVPDASANDQSKLTTPAKSARKTLSRDFRAEISPMVGSGGRFARQVQTPLSVSTPAGKRRSTRQQQQIAVDISPLAVPMQGTPVKNSPQNEAVTPEMPVEQETSIHENGEPQDTSFTVGESESVHQLYSATETDQTSTMNVTPEDSTTESLNSVETSIVAKNVMSSAEETIDSSSRSTRLSKRVSRSSNINVSQHEDLSNVGEESALDGQAPDVTSVDESNLSRSNLTASILEQDQQDNQIDLSNPNDIVPNAEESTPPPTDRRASSRHSVAVSAGTPTTAVQRRRTTTAASTPQPEIRPSKRGVRQSIAVMSVTTDSVDKGHVDQTMSLSESMLPLRSPLPKNNEPLNESSGGNDSISGTVTQDVAEKKAVDSEPDVTNVDSSVVSIADSPAIQDSSLSAVVPEDDQQPVDASTLEQSTVSEAVEPLEDDQADLSNSGDNEPNAEESTSATNRRVSSRHSVAALTGSPAVPVYRRRTTTTSSTSQIEIRSMGGVRRSIAVIGVTSPSVDEVRVDRTNEALNASTEGNTTIAGSITEDVAETQTVDSEKDVTNVDNSVVSIEDVPAIQDSSCVSAIASEEDKQSMEVSTLDKSTVSEAMQSLKDDQADLSNPDDAAPYAEQSSRPTDRRVSSRHTVAASASSTATAVQRRRTTTASSTAQPEIRSMRGVRRSIAVMADVAEKGAVHSEQDVTNVDTSVVSIVDSPEIQDSSCMSAVVSEDDKQPKDESTLEQSTISEAAPESPVRQGRSSLRTPRTPVTASSNNERLSMTVEKPMRKPANGTPLLRKAIFAMCTPTRTSRSSVTKAVVPQESTPKRVSRSASRATIGELASFSEATPLKVEEESADTIAVDRIPEEMEASASVSTPIKTASRTRGSVSNAGTPVPTPVSSTTKTPASVRRSLMTPKADMPATQLTELATPSRDSPAMELSTSNKNARRASRRLTIAKESTPARQSLTQTETEAHNESNATEVLNELEQPLPDKSVEQQEPIVTDEFSDSMVVASPVKQTPRSRRRDSAVQTPASMRKQAGDSVVEKSMVVHDSASLPAEKATTEHSPNQLIQNVSLDGTNVSDDIHVEESSGILPDPSSNDGTLHETAADVTPIKHTPRTRGRPSKPDTPVSIPASVMSKQAIDIKTPSSVRKSMLKTSQLLEHIPEKAVEQDDIVDTTTKAVTPAKAIDTSRLELTPTCPVTPAGLDVVFKTPRPVRDTRMSLATPKKTPATFVPASDQMVSQNTVGRRSARRSTSGAVDSPSVTEVDTNEVPQSAERSSSFVGDKTTPTNVVVSPFVVEETPRKTISPSEDATTTSVDLCPDLLKHLCERVITLENAMENLEDPSQQSLEITAANSTDNLEGIKHLLETPAATSTVRKKLRSSTAVGGSNDTVDLEGVGQLLKSPSAEKSSLLQTSVVAPETRKALRLSAASIEHNESSNLDASTKLYLAEVSIGSSVDDTANATTDLEGVQQLLKTPSAVTNCSINLEGVQQLLKTPNANAASVSVRSRNTRSSTAALDSTMYLDGVQQLLKTPATSVAKILPSASKSSATNETNCDATSDMEGVEQMLATPTASIVSVSKRTRTTRRSTAPLDTTMHLEGVQQLLKTPIVARVLPNDSYNLEGVQQMLKTPAASVSKKPAMDDTGSNATLDLEGVEQMLATPNASAVSVLERTRTTRRSTTPLDTTMHLEGVQQLLKTPIARVLPNDSYNLDGVQQMLMTPAASLSKEPAVMNNTGNDTTLDMEGVQQMLSTPNASVVSVSQKTRSTRSSTVGLDNTMQLEGVEQLLKTPVVARVLPNNSYNLEGVQQMLKTPSASVSKKPPAMDDTDSNSTLDMEGIQQMLTTPNASVASVSQKTRSTRNSTVPLDTTVQLEGVQQLLKTPAASVSKKRSSVSNSNVMNETDIDTTLDMEGLRQILATPKANEASMSHKIRNTRHSTAPLNSTMKSEGVQKLLQTPVAARTLPNDSYNLDGVEQLLKTPATTAGMSMRSSTTSKMLDSIVNFSVVNQTVDSLTASISNELFETSETESNCITPAKMEDTATANADEVILSVKQLDTPASSMNRSTKNSTASESFDFEGVHQLLKTPITVRKSPRSSLLASPNLTGVQQLMATPVSSPPVSSKKSPAVPKTPGAVNLDGVQQLFKTPGAPLTGRKTLRSSTIANTPHALASPNDSTSLEGVHQLLKTPDNTTSLRRSAVATELNSTVSNSSNLTGVQQLLTTPEAFTSEKLSNTPAALNTSDRNETVDMDGIQQLLTTPHTTPVLNSSVDLEGLKQLLDTPVVKGAPNDSAHLEGIQRLLTTPAAAKKSLRSSALDNELNLTGVQQLMATPQATSTVKRITTAPKTPSGDANFDGVQQMFKTPVALTGSRRNMRSNVTKINLDESINYDGLQQLLGTPVASTPIVKSTRNDSIPDSTMDLEGIDQLLSTPVAIASTSDKMRSPIVSGSKSPIEQTSMRKSLRTSVLKSGLNNSSHLEGIEKMLQSPVVKVTTFNSTALLEGVDQLLQTPHNTSTIKAPLKTPQDVSANLSNVQKLFQTPNPPSAQKRQNRSSKAVEVSSTTPNVFDKSVNLEGLERDEQLQNTNAVNLNLKNKVDSVPVVSSGSTVQTSRSSDLFSPPTDDQSSSDTVNVAGIIQMLDTSNLTAVEDKSPKDTGDKLEETPAVEKANQPDILEQTRDSLPKSVLPTPAKVVNVSVTVSTEIGTPTQQRLRRKLYTKNDPDDKTPERIKSTVVRPVTSNEYLHIMDPSTLTKEDTSEEKRNRLGKNLTKPTEELTDSESDSNSDYESVEVVEPVRKILPSRASRRNIKTLSEEALAGASPELKYVKPKPPKIVEEPSPVIVAETLPTINEDSAINTEDLSAGRRKVMFNENIQIKEINSPAIVGDIIQKVSRGRGGKHQKAVQVIVEQHSIKPARRDNKYEQKDGESNKLEEETDTSKRSRRGTKRVNYAEETNENTKSNETTKRSRRGANKVDNAEKIINEADASATKEIDVKTTKRSKREAKKHESQSSEQAVETETASSVNTEETFEKDHAEQPGSTDPDVKEGGVIEESNVNVQETQANVADSASSISEEDKKVEESKPKRTRRPTAKSKAEPKKPSSRSRSKKAEIVPEVEESEKEATSNDQAVQLEGSEDDTVKANEEQQPSQLETITVDASDAKADKLNMLSDEGTVDAKEEGVVGVRTEELAAKRSRRPAKKTKPEPNKASSKTNSKKIYAEEKQETSQLETTATAEESKRTELHANQESSHPAEDTTDVNEKPAAKRSRRAPSKVAKDITPPESINAEVQSSNGETEHQEEKDTETVSGRGKRGAKKTTSRSAKSKVVEVPPDSNKGEEAVVKAAEETSESTETEKAKPVPRTAKSRQRRVAATTTGTVDDSIPKMEIQASAESTDISAKALHIVEAPVVEQAVADSTSQDEPQPAPVKRSRNTRKPASKAKTPKEEQPMVEEDEVAAMPPPAMIITAEPDESASKKSVRRGRQKPVAEESHPELHHTIEESLNESRMVKTMLPSSHTSTPLMRIEEEKPKTTRGGRTRKLNPAVAALIEAEVTTTPNRSSPRNLRAGSQSRMEDSQTAQTALKAKTSRIRNAPKMKSVDDSHDQPQSEKHTSNVIAEEDPTEVNDAADITPSKARKNPPTKRVRGKVVEQSESDEHQEVAPKRARKVPTKYRDVQAEVTEEVSKDVVEPTRNRRGAKSVKQVEEPTTTTTTEASETNDESETVQAKPSRSRKVPAKYQETRPDSASKLEDTEDASKENVEPTRNRRNAKPTKKTEEATRTLATKETTETNDESEDVEVKPSRSRKVAATKRPAAASRKKVVDVADTEEDEASAVKQTRENEEPVETSSSRRRPLRTRR